MRKVVIGHETITVGAVAVGPTASVRCPASGEFQGKAADEAYFSVKTAGVKYRDDGGAPASGHELGVGDGRIIEGAGLVAGLQWIRSGAVDGAVVVTYYLNR